MHIPDDDWKLEGICNTVDPELFFPTRNEEGEDTVYNPVVAKRICGACPVQSECLEFALRNNEQYGIWGGTSHIERREILRERGILRPGNSGHVKRIVSLI